MADGVTSTIQ